MTVSIHCRTRSAEIRYTIDGTTPTATTGQIYKSPIHLTVAGTVKAIAVTKDDQASGLAVATFSVPPPPPMKLVMLDDYGDVHEAVLVNEKTKERQIVQEGEPFDDGRLVLALPRAAIGQADNGDLYVYWLGKELKDKEILDKNRQPDLYKQVQSLVVFEK